MTLTIIVQKTTYHKRKRKEKHLCQTIQRSYDNLCHKILKFLSLFFFFYFLFRFYQKVDPDPVNISNQKV